MILRNNRENKDANNLELNKPRQMDFKFLNAPFDSFNSRSRGFSGNHVINHGASFEEFCELLCCLWDMCLVLDIVTGRSLMRQTIEIPNRKYARKWA